MLDLIRIALVGCGNRGSGACREALSTKAPVKLVAMGDLFASRLETSLKNLSKYDELRPRIDVPPERRFVGFDAYEKVLAAGVDLVLFATPPHFRPRHFAAAVTAGKHVFLEKPCCVERARLPTGAGGQRRGEGQAALGRRRPATPPSAALFGEGQANSRRRDRRGPTDPHLLQHGRRPGGRGADAADERDGVPDPFLEPLLLALRRPHRRAGLPQHRRGELDHGRPPGPRQRHGHEADSARGRAPATSSTGTSSNTNMPTARATTARRGSSPALGATSPRT